MARILELAFLPTHERDPQQQLLGQTSHSSIALSHINAQAVLKALVDLVTPPALTLTSTNFLCFFLSFADRMLGVL